MAFFIAFFKQSACLAFLRVFSLFHLPQRRLASQLASHTFLLCICIISRKNPLLLPWVEPEHTFLVQFQRCLA